MSQVEIGMCVSALCRVACRHESSARSRWNAATAAAAASAVPKLKFFCPSSPLFYIVILVYSNMQQLAVNLITDYKGK